MQSAMAYALDEIAGSTVTTHVLTSTSSRSTTPPPTTSSGRRTPSAASRSSRQVSVSWSASSPPRRSTTSSSTSPATRPGPVKSDMVGPFLRARHGWELPSTCTPTSCRCCARPAASSSTSRSSTSSTSPPAAPARRPTRNRRALGDPDGQAETREWFYRRRGARGPDLRTVERFWDVLAAFASFGFCKAHAAACASTYQSAWLKARPRRQLHGRCPRPRPGAVPETADPRRRAPVRVALPLDVNASGEGYRVERVDPTDAWPVQDHRGPA